MRGRDKARWSEWLQSAPPWNDGNVRNEPSGVKMRVVQPSLKDTGCRQKKRKLQVLT